MSIFKVSSTLPYGESGPVKTVEGKSARDAAIYYTSRYFPEYRQAMACDEQRPEWNNDTMTRIWRMSFHGSISAIVVWIREV